MKKNKEQEFLKNLGSLYLCLLQFETINPHKFTEKQMLSFLDVLLHAHLMINILERKLQLFEGANDVIKTSRRA